MSFKLTPENNERLNDLCGQLDDHLHYIERHLAVEISHRGHTFKILGPQNAVEHAKQCLVKLYQATIKGSLTLAEVNLVLHSMTHVEQQSPSHEKLDPGLKVITSKLSVKPRGLNQQRYLKRILKHDINFGIGPAGTGKTFLAVACAVAALEAEQVGRLVLVRPAVEAGESLGFLPGDLAQKVDPYLRPIYDALYELMGFEQVTKLIGRQVIEIAPLAFMRGRTLNDAFIILDESQNTTREQMKMFLTRVGFNSTTVITGDITQVDLPRGKASGLRHVINVLEGVEDISFTFFDNSDVVRHPLVQKVVNAYDKFEKQETITHD